MHPTKHLQMLLKIIVVHFQLRHPVVAVTATPPIAAREERCAAEANIPVDDNYIQRLGECDRGEHRFQEIGNSENVKFGVPVDPRGD